MYTTKMNTEVLRLLLLSAKYCNPQIIKKGNSLEFICKTYIIVWLMGNSTADDNPIPFRHLVWHVRSNCLYTYVVPLSPLLRLQNRFVYIFITPAAFLTLANQMFAHISQSFAAITCPSLSPFLPLPLFLFPPLSLSSPFICPSLAICLYEIAFVVGKLDLCTNSFRSRWRVYPPPLPIKAPLLCATALPLC